MYFLMVFHLEKFKDFSIIKFEPTCQLVHSQFIKYLTEISNKTETLVVRKLLFELYQIV